MANKIVKPIEGYIVKRKDGRFEGRFADNGKRKSVYAYTYKDCLYKLKCKLQVRDNQYTLHVWLDEWLSIYKKNKITDSYLTALKSAISYIKQYMKDKPLELVSALDVQRYLNELDNTRTKESVYSVLNASFKKAYALQLIDFNIMLAVEPYKHKRKKGKELNNDELVAFFKNLGNNSIKNYYLMCLFTGARRGEVLQIRKKDFNFVENNLHIRGTKTENSDRYIPLFKSIKTLVAPMLDLLSENDLLFKYNADYVTHFFAKNCPNHKLHDLRHTFATECLKSGVPLKICQMWLGHSSIEVTGDIYTHVTKDIAQCEVTKVDTFLTPFIFPKK